MDEESEIRALAEIAEAIFVEHWDRWQEMDQEARHWPRLLAAEDI
jgi:hypothetical protein